MEGSRLAISQRVVNVDGYGEIRDCLDQEWTVWIESLGLVPVPVPNRLENVASFCDRMGVGGIFLSGGNNIHGTNYEEPSVCIGDTSQHRDATERALIDLAIARRLPLIGWCRGLQMLQTYFDGELASTVGGAVGHVATTHPVEIVSELHRSLAGSSLTVNSYHDYGVRRTALVAPLQPLAVSEDDFVEAAFHRSLPIVACQWHPERTGGSDEFNRLLVQHVFNRKEAR